MKTLDEAIQQIFRPHIIFAKESEAGLEGEEVVKRQLYWGGELVRNRVVMEAMLPMAVELFVAQVNAGMGVEDVVNNIGITMLSYGVAIGLEMEKGELTDGRPPVSNRANPMAQHPPFQAMVRKIVDQARVLVEEVASPLDSEWAYEDFKAAVFLIAHGLFLASDAVQAGDYGISRFQIGRGLVGETPSTPEGQDAGTGAR